MTKDVEPESKGTPGRAAHVRSGGGVAYNMAEKLLCNPVIEEYEAEVVE
ncbi:MAG: phosphoribosylformylglycinamidine synthase subunit PurS [Holophagales bacterium]|nr:phosphoribosylformylglycinamidine synthase subunit PurS [Holophagales bacterium]